MIYLYFLIALLLPVTATAELTELLPDGCVSEAESDCTSSNCGSQLAEDCDDNPSDANRCQPDICGPGSTASDVNVRVTMPTPPADLTTGADLQTVRLRAKKCGCGAEDTPGCQLDVYDAGGLHHAGSRQEFPSCTVEGNLRIETWDATGISCPDGSCIEFVMDCDGGTGGPSDDRAVALLAIDWIVDHDAVSSRSRRFMVID